MMTQQYDQTLRSIKLKATPKRVAILKLLAATPTYASPEDIWHQLQGEFSSIGLPTVYRNLEELAEGGLVSKVIHPNRQLYYYLCTNQEHHHHFICLSCRRVEDMAGCSMAAIEQDVLAQTGGQVLSHILQVNGLCRDCADSNSRPGGAQLRRGI